MANDKNKINDLVSPDDDPTAELEILAFQPDESLDAVTERESDADTSGLGHRDNVASSPGPSIPELQLDLETRSKTIGRLQYDIQQLRSKWLGLEAEIQAREQIVSNLSRDADALRDTVLRKDKLLKKRDQTIKSLKSEIRERDEAYRSLSQQCSELEEQVSEHRLNGEEDRAALQDAERETARTGSRPDDSAENQRAPAIVLELANTAVVNEIQAQLARTEEYADSLRRKIQDLTESQSALLDDRDHLADSLEQMTARNRDLSDELGSANESITELQTAVGQLQKDHEQEIRMLRFELGEAQDTLAQTGELNAQLASDLVDTRGFKEELERMLCKTEEQAQARIAELEKQLSKLSRATEDFEQKLDTKSTAINVLLSELAKKSEQIECIGEIEEVIHDIDDRMSERIDEPADSEAPEPHATHANSDRDRDRDRDRITRVLIGRIGEQELRFPLFKNRLTIGRTAQNDIQLQASYISRRHAVILTEGDTARIVDWGSKNGVYVNSQRVKEHFLSNGDIVSVGNAKFRYEERPKRET